MGRLKWVNKFKEIVLRISKRKPKIRNWLSIIGLILLFVFWIYYEIFVPHPEIPGSSASYDGLYMDAENPNVRIRVYNQDDAIIVAPSVPDIMTNPEVADEAKLKELKDEISLLESRKKTLGNNISELENQNLLLSNLNFEMQNKIMSFVKQGRLFDILLSAFVGAAVSVTLSYLLSVPNVRKRIDDYLWTDDQKSVSL